MTERYVCVHGHFYQPPRENPWLEAVELQDSAYPYHDWNERVTAECYAPNANARVLDHAGFITDICNNYSRLSFNFGPTLLGWLTEQRADVFLNLRAADAASVARHSGHGSALAQAYNHMIVPLANAGDRKTQIAWGLADFRHRFGREAEGMWLPETAANVAALEDLAAAGIRYTILAPGQARRVRPLGGRAWKDVAGGRIDPSRAYQAVLPSRRKLALFFYDGPIARAVAFEGLLNDGSLFARRLLDGFSEARAWPQLMHIATDGESYGHHHRKGEMALASALNHIEQEGGVRLTNYGEFLAAHPPTHEVEIWENSSWSCVHGVERWRSNCGCNSGGHAGWNQEWRQPLRAALDWLRDHLAPAYESEAAKLLRDPWAARDAYIGLVLDRTSANADAFFERHQKAKLAAGERTRALRLLELQRHAMLMYTSCGWFFDELSGLETVQVLQYAGRAIQLAEELFDTPIEENFLKRLEAARSNIAANGNGRDVWMKFVRPARVSLPQVAAHYAVSSLFEEYAPSARIYGFNVSRGEGDVEVQQSGRLRLAHGRIRVDSRITGDSGDFTYAVLHLGDHNLSGGVRPFTNQLAFDNQREQLRSAFSRADVPQLLRDIDHNFGAGVYSLKLLFRDEQRKILERVLESTRGEAETTYRQLYEQHAPLLRFLHDLAIPAPGRLEVAADMALKLQLFHAIQTEPLDLERVRGLAAEAVGVGVDLAKGEDLGLELGRALERLAGRLRRDPENTGRLRDLLAAVILARELPFDTVLGPVQDVAHALPAPDGDGAWREAYGQLFEALRMRLPVGAGDKAAVAHMANPAPPGRAEDEGAGERAA